MCVHLSLSVLCVFWVCGHPEHFLNGDAAMALLNLILVSAWVPARSVCLVCHTRHRSLQVDEMNA